MATEGGDGVRVAPGVNLQADSLTGKRFRYRLVGQVASGWMSRSEVERELPAGSRSELIALAEANPVPTPPRSSSTCSFDHFM